jgi:two-component system, response regulator
MSNQPILLVEDNPDDLTFTLRAFRKSNISNEIVVATDGEQALSILLPENAAPSFRPMLVLLDVNLPKISGMEVLRRMRADPRTQSLPVVVLTTSAEEARIVSSHRFGTNSFVRKPVVFSDFLSAASLLGMHWLITNQRPESMPLSLNSVS